MYYFLYENINDAVRAAREVNGKVFKASIVGYRDGFVAVTKSNKKPIAWSIVPKIFEPRIRSNWEGRHVITRMKAFKYGYSEDYIKQAKVEERRFREQETPDFMYIGD